MCKIALCEICIAIMAGIGPKGTFQTQKRPMCNFMVWAMTRALDGHVKKADAHSSWQLTHGDALNRVLTYFVV